MEKLKNWVHSKSCKATVVVSGIVTALVPAASAADADTTAITTAFTTGFTKMASDALAMIAVIVPIAIGVAGAIFLSKKAMGWFKSLAK